MATYAAMIDRMDQGIGRVLAKLDALDIMNETLIIFLSDNGGCAEFLAEDGPVNRKVPQLPDGRPVQIGNRVGLRPGSADTYMSYDLPWANASNSPFRLYKHWVHEGGISSPCIVHYPAAVEAGRIIHSPIQFIDVLPTFAELADASYPSEFGGCAIQPGEGESFLPALLGGDWLREQPLYWEHEGNRALRVGDWKLVSKHPGDWELYNMLDDRTELNDLSAGEGERVRTMSGLYDSLGRNAARCVPGRWTNLLFDSPFQVSRISSGRRLRQCAPPSMNTLLPLASQVSGTAFPFHTKRYFLLCHRVGPRDGS